jgi:hypothetical protein
VWDRTGLRRHTVGNVAVNASWRTPDTRWLIDRVVDEPGVGYRIWYEGELVGEVAGDPAALSCWLAARDVDVAQLVALPAGEGPFCE